jgi:hypothetical protein
MDKENYTTESVLAELLVRLTALESLLISNNIIDGEQLANKNKEIAEIIVKYINKNSNDLNEIAKKFKDGEN